jgi:hypothetical protein
MSSATVETEYYDPESDAMKTKEEVEGKKMGDIGEDDEEYDEEDDEDEGDDDEGT